MPSNRKAEKSVTADAPFMIAKAAADGVVTVWDRYDAQ